MTDRKLGLESSTSYLAGALGNADNETSPPACSFLALSPWDQMNMNPKDRRVVQLLVVFLAAGAGPSAIAVAGPPVDTAADLVLDDFEGPVQWRTAKQGAVEVVLDRAPGLSHSGQDALQVRVKAGIAEKGRNAFRLTRTLPEGLDASEYEGLQFWIKPVVGANSLKCCLHQPKGVRYRAGIELGEKDLGQWTFVRIPFQKFHWDFESAKTTAKTPDLKTLVAVSLWDSLPDKGEKVFYVDDLAFYKPRAPYAGPTIRLRASARSAIVRPGESLQVLGQVTHLPVDGTFQLKLDLEDYFGNAMKRRTLPVVANPQGEFAFQVPAPGSPYAQLTATLQQADKPVFTESYSVATIPTLSDEDRDGISPFGTWVGGVAFPMEQGASWFRTYCEPWQFEPDGSGGYRYLGKGAFPRPMPYRQTPICYFRGMPKWLTSRPDRVDYQKFPPNDWDAYGRFVTWYVGQMKPYIKHWEVWNEPVPYAYWMGTVEEMVRLHEVTYKAVKKADPEAIVLGPCPYTFLFPFLEKFFELGGAQWIDAVVVHAYTSGSPESGGLDENLNKLRELMARHAGTRDLYITELGWDAGRVGWTRQAQYLVRSHVLCMEAGVKALIWHMYWDYGGDGPGGYALLNHNHTPRPALVAYCQLMRMLRRATFTRRLTELTDPQRAYEFTGPHGRVILAWCWNGSQTARIAVNADAVEAFDILGQSRPATVRDKTVEVQLDENPIYVCPK